MNYSLYIFNAHPPPCAILTVSLRDAGMSVTVFGSRKPGGWHSLRHETFPLSICLHRGKKGPVSEYVHPNWSGADIPDISFPARHCNAFSNFSAHGYCLFPNGRDGSDEFRAFFFTVVIGGTVAQHVQW